MITQEQALVLCAALGPDNPPAPTAHPARAMAPALPLAGLGADLTQIQQATAALRARSLLERAADAGFRLAFEGKRVAEDLAERANGPIADAAKRAAPPAPYLSGPGTREPEILRAATLARRLLKDRRDIADVARIRTILETEEPALAPVAREAAAPPAILERKK
jgi:hypothetical protein